jgi:hypothetical protein
MTPLYTIARDIDDALGGTACRDAIEASTADLSLVLWRFLAAVMREMRPAPAKVQVAIAPVIAGMDRLGRGEEWPEAAARAAARAAEAAANVAANVAEATAAAASWAASSQSATEAARAAAAWVARAAAEAAAWAADAAWAATFASVPRKTQRDILLRLIKEAIK